MNKILILITLVSYLFGNSDSLLQVRYDQIQYLNGNITLGDNLAELSLDTDFVYINPHDAKFVLEKIWGNPPGGENLGIFFPRQGTLIGDSTWFILIEYSDDGHIKDDDAEDINYDDLLKNMKEASVEENKKRKEAGYPTIDVIGWAEPPYYNENERKIYWARELFFEGAETNTLNYNIRILGRQGYLLFNVISGIDLLPQVKKDMPQVLSLVDFLPGNQYEDFDESTDKIAGYGLAGLVAGGALAKAGFFKMLLAGILALKKFLIIAVMAIIVAVKKFLFANDKKQRVLVEKNEE